MMSLIPDFKIGWCNGWLGTIPIILSMIILFISNKGAAKRAVNMSAYTVKEKCQTFVSTVLFFGAVLYSVGLPLRLETMWFYIGMLVILHTAINHLTVLAEESYCSEKYGKSYREYMKNVPRYFLFF